MITRAATLAAITDTETMTSSTIDAGEVFATRCREAYLALQCATGELRMINAAAIAIVTIRTGKTWPC